MNSGFKMKKNTIFLILTILVFLPVAVLIFATPLLMQVEVVELGGVITETVIRIPLSGTIITDIFENGLRVDHSTIDPSDIGAKSYAASFIPAFFGCFSVFFGPIMIFANDKDYIIGKSDRWSSMSVKSTKRMYRVMSISTIFISGLGLLGLLVYIIPFRNNLLSTYPDIMPTFSFYYSIIVVAIGFFAGIARTIVMPKDIRNLVDYGEESDPKLELDSEHSVDSDELAELHKKIEQITVDDM